MPTYNDLSKRYSEYSSEQFSYWRDLISFANEVYIGFANYLDIVDKYYDDNNGKSQRYLQLGIYKDDHFIEKYDGFPTNGKNLSISFDMKIVLEKAPDIDPKFGLITMMEVSRRNGIYYVTLKKKDKDKTFEIPRAQEMIVIFEAIYSDIYETIDPQIFK